MVIEAIFFLALLLVIYTYSGYPLVIFALSRWFPRPVQQSESLPRLSLIIAAHNEERDIAAKLEHTLALDYPAERLEVIVASDCSTDRTDEIANSFAGRGVKLYRQAEHLGKTVAQHNAVKIATGEFLVFTDATTRYTPDALRKLVRNFADPTVGCVAGQLIYVESTPNNTLDSVPTSVGRGCRSYWDYEKFLKSCESRVGSLIGVSGCLYAVRRSSFAQLRPELIDDFVVATEIHLRGLRTVYEPEAIATEGTNRRSRDEFCMRVRVIEQTLTALHQYREVLKPWRHGLFACQMLSHKVLRYAVPMLLLVVLISNALLVERATLFQLTLLAQVLFYAAALAGWVADQRKLRVGPLALPYYFILANAAALVAGIKFLCGEHYVVWTPIREANSSIQRVASEVSGDVRVFGQMARQAK